MSVENRLEIRSLRSAICGVKKGNDADDFGIVEIIDTMTLFPFLLYTNYTLHQKCLRGRNCDEGDLTCCLCYVDLIFSALVMSSSYSCNTNWTTVNFRIHYFVESNRESCQY